jgi:cytochrome c oxidase cbb3-type subunit I
MAAPSEGIYSDQAIRLFSLAAVLWGVVGMLVGVIIAAQLTWPELNFGIPYISYGRLRPLHTNAVIFAFGGCTLFATSYHVVQRTCQTRLFAPKLALFTFIGWQVVILAAALSLPLGYTQGKEYAELEWPIDLLIAVVWVSYAIVFFGTVGTRKVRHIYVANWFFGAFIIAVALLHIVNSVAIPAGLMKSYSAYAGVQDAMIQWWYGHNAVGFFLTAGFLGIMYYYIPKQAERPVYSYRLSIVHFWALIFTYMWAGPHHLHYTALPDWAQSIGMIFSLVLLAPSWGGMINGIMTLSGAWHKLRDDPILKFLIVSLSFYGMSTFEGPMMSIKTVNALSHYTDWTVGHVHSGALGWVGMISMGALYHLIPRMYGKTAMYSTKAILGSHHRHRAVHRRNVDCRRDAGPDVACSQPRRHAGVQLRREREGHLPLLRGAPAWWAAVPERHADHGLERGDDRALGQGRASTDSPRRRRARLTTSPSGHEKIETSNFLMIVLILLAVAVGGLVEIVPLFFQRSTTQPVEGLKPYTPLQLAGRDVYLREGCYGCHSQMVRPFRAEALRYGPLSQAGEFVYDHPFQWGSKRTGPDLHRVGGKYSDEWHRIHLINPRDLVPESNMPAYPWLERDLVDASEMAPRMKALRVAGVPYTDAEIAQAAADVKGRTEMEALIAYLQVLGTARK